MVDGAGVFALQPALVALRLEEAHKRVHGDLHHVFTARALRERDRERERERERAYGGVMGG